MAANGYSDRRTIQRLLQQARPYRIHILGLFLLDLSATPLALLKPVPLKIAIDSVIGTERLPGFVEALSPAAAHESSTVLALAIGLLVGTVFLNQLQRLGSSLLRTCTGERMVLGFRAELFRHVQNLSLSYHRAKGTSDSMYRIQYDASAIQYIAIDGIIPFITASMTLASMLYVTFRVDWQLALVALAVSPLLFLLARIYRRRLRRQSRQVKELESAALSVVQEVLTVLRVVKAFGQEDREQERYVHRANEGMQARLRYAFAEGGLGLFLGMTTGMGTAIVLLIGVRHVQSGMLTLGSLLLVMGYLSQLYGPLRTISRKVASVQSHLASAERAYALLDRAPDVAERPNARPVSRAKGAVTFDDVSFSYDTAQPVLRDVSFEIPAGTRVGVAGKTGAGKTTVVSLLIRFYDPGKGRIFLDGVDLRDYRVVDLRDQYAIVLQEPVLFSTSIAENIAYARPDANAEEIVGAAKAANVHDFIVSLPNGYDTPVGERGMLLSGGERQRIALACAFLKDAPILIMDEPTSSVDMKTESGIIEALERLMCGRTTFMIAHRLTTLEKCDVLLVIDDGQLVGITSDVAASVQRALEMGGLEAGIPGAVGHG
jgi:ATP-binding cassette subfamily B protein